MADEIPPSAPSETPAPKRGKTGTAADNVTESAQLEKSLSALRQKIEETNSKNSEDMLGLRTELEKLVGKSQIPNVPISEQEDPIWGNFWKGFFD